METKIYILLGCCTIMCYLILHPYEKDELKQLKETVKYFKSTIRHLDREDALYKHKKIMFSRLAYQLSMEAKIIVYRGRNRRYIQIKSFFKNTRYKLGKVLK